MLKKKVNSDHVEGHDESHITSVQEKLRTLSEGQLQEIPGSGPIEIRIYEEASDSGRMMLKISFAK